MVKLYKYHFTSAIFWERPLQFSHDTPMCRSTAFRSFRQVDRICLASTMLCNCLACFTYPCAEDFSGHLTSEYDYCVLCMDINFPSTCMSGQCKKSIGWRIERKKQALILHFVNVQCSCSCRNKHLSESVSTNRYEENKSVHNNHRVIWRENIVSNSQPELTRHGELSGSSVSFIVVI